MPFFTIRVELHGARSPTDYLTLEQALATRGIVDVISSDDGRRWKLPPAEYSYTGNVTMQQVLDGAKAAAAVTGIRCAVLVSECERRSWEGLEKV